MPATMRAARHDRDMGVGQQRRARSACRAPESSTSVPVSAIAQNTPVMPSLSSPVVGRASIASPAPAQSRSASSGQHTPCRDRCAASAGGQLERVEITRNARRNLAPIGDALDGAFHVGRALHEARDQIVGHARPRALGVRGDDTLRRSRARRPRPSRAGSCQRIAHAAENPVARRVVAAGAHRLLVSMNDGDALDAGPDRRRRRRIRKADVLAVAGHAPSEMDVGQHRDAGFVQQALAEFLRIGATGQLACLGDVRPGVERAARRLAADARNLVQQTDDQVAPLEERAPHRARRRPAVR